MANIYVKSGGGTIGAGTWRGLWSASQTWAVGDRIVAANVISYRVMECTTGGAGGAGAEPTWNTSTGGTTTDNAAVWTTRIPSTWANATVDLTRAAANDAAGDTIYVSHQHAESTGANIALALTGTQTSPSKVLCVNDGAEPPTTLATTATVSTAGDFSIATVGGTTTYVHFYGIGFIAGVGSAGASANITSVGMCLLEDCSFQLASTNASCRVTIGQSGAPTRLLRPSFKFAAAGQGIATGSTCSITSASLLSGGTSPTTLFLITGTGHVVSVDALDLTNADAAINLASISGNGTELRLRNYKLPASWSGGLTTGSLIRGAVAQGFNGDSGDTNYRYRKATEFGTIQEETTLVRTGGGSDGDTGISWRMVTNANAEHPMLTLDSLPLTKRINTVGSAVTLKAQILHDSATNLTDAEVWLEVQYLGTSGVPLGSFVSDGISVVATAADQTASSETWTTTGMANPNKQALSVTFTPQEKGFAIAVIKLAKASKTIYLCGKLDQS